MIGGGLLAQGYAVGEKLHFGQVGIDGDLGHILHPVDIALAAQMHEGIIAQPGLIGIEGVLLVFAAQITRPFSSHRS